MPLGYFLARKRRFAPSLAAQSSLLCFSVVAAAQLRLHKRRMGQSMSTAKAIKKAIFPVAGLGTRFLPATKSIPKEMLTIVDRPIIDYAVREAIEAGCETLIFITGRHKRAIEDYFDKDRELEAELLAKNKMEAL